METCESKTDTVEHFLQGLDQSQWLKHVKAVLEASVFISEVMTDCCITERTDLTPLAAVHDERGECGGSLF